MNFLWKNFLESKRKLSAFLSNTSENMKYLSIVLLLSLVIAGLAFHSPFQNVRSMRSSPKADERHLKLAMYQGPVTNGDVQANLKLITGLITDFDI